MAFEASFFDGTYKSGISTIGAGVPDVYYSKRFLDFLTEKLILAQFAQKRPLPEGNGKTVEFYRWRSVAATFTALTEGVNPDATKIYGQKIQTALAEYGNFAQITSLVDQAHIDTGMEGAVDIMSEQAANTMDGLLQRELGSNGSYPMAADHTSSSTSRYGGVLGTVTSTTILAGGAALEANATYGDTDDDLNQSVIIITSGPAEGEARIITDYDADGAATGTAVSGKMTVSPAFNMTPVAGDSFVVCTPDEVTTGDDLSYANVKAARTILKKNLAMPFDGGYFIGVVGPDAANNLMDDSDWKNVNIYKDQTTGIYDQEIGKFAGVRFVEHTSPFLFPIETRGTAGTAGGPGVSGANQSDSGTVQTVFIFGKNSFGITTFSKKGGGAINPPVIVKRPTTATTSDPLNRYRTVGWVMEIAHKALFAKHCVGIWCSAT